MRLPEHQDFALIETRHEVHALSEKGLRAFTLMEVMIAVAIFFMALFTILEVVSQGLNSARRLQRKGPTASIIASELSLTNSLEEGMESGDFELYPDYTWTREIVFAGSNGLFRVDFAVFHGAQVDSTMSVLLYRPQSTALPGGGGLRR